MQKKKTPPIIALHFKMIFCFPKSIARTRLCILGPLNGPYKIDKRLPFACRHFSDLQIKVEHFLLPHVSLQPILGIGLALPYLLSVSCTQTFTLVCFLSTTVWNRLLRGFMRRRGKTGVKGEPPIVGVFVHNNSYDFAPVVDVISRRVVA